MTMHSVDELLRALQDPAQIDAFAEQLSEILPAPNLDDPNAPLVPGQASGQQATIQQAAPAQQAPAQQAPATVSPSIDFAQTLLGRGGRNA